MTLLLNIWCICGIKGQQNVTEYALLKEIIIFSSPFARYYRICWGFRWVGVKAVYKNKMYISDCVHFSLISNQTSMVVSCQPKRTGTGTEPIKLLSNQPLHRNLYSSCSLAGQLGQQHSSDLRGFYRCLWVGFHCWLPAIATYTLGSSVCQLPNCVLRW